MQELLMFPPESIQYVQEAREVSVRLTRGANDRLVGEIDVKFNEGNFDWLSIPVHGKYVGYGGMRPMGAGFIVGPVDNSKAFQSFQGELRVGDKVVLLFKNMTHLHPRLEKEGLRWEKVSLVILRDDREIYYDLKDLITGYNDDDRLVQFM